MLSILIPVYNFDVRELVGTLHKQASSSGIAFEIRCYDDASEKAFNEINSAIASLDKVIFEKLDRNLGRSAIRNKLAKEAAFDNLLFMDCDSRVPDSDFLKRYVANLDGKSVIYGGRSYEANPPADKTQYLRWKYGVDRESIPVEVRKSRPHDSFMTNNFLIPKKVFMQIKLDEEMKGYGHEDTKFGYMLLQQQVPVVHINNPLLHIGLEHTDEFLKKTKEGLGNLLYLYRKEQIPLSHLRNIRLLRYFNLLKKTGMRTLFLAMYRLVNSGIEKNLHSTNASMLFFDVYRLGKLTELSFVMENR